MGVYLSPFLPTSPYGGVAQDANLLYLLLSFGKRGSPVPQVLCPMPASPVMLTDLNKDGKVDMKDIGRIARDFGKTY
jgi:hypothetical protein